MMTSSLLPSPLVPGWGEEREEGRRGGGEGVSVWGYVEEGGTMEGEEEEFCVCVCVCVCVCACVCACVCVCEYTVCTTFE